MIRRPRVAVVAAVALLGVLAGGLLVSVVAPAPSPLPPVERTPSRPAGLSERLVPPSPVLRTPDLPGPEDTGGTEPATPPPEPAAEEAGALPLGRVTCTVIGDPAELEIQLVPSFEIMEELADELSAALDEGRGGEQAAAVARTRLAFGGETPWTRRGDKVSFEAVVGSPSATFTGRIRAADGTLAPTERDVPLQWDADGGRCADPVDFTRSASLVVSGRIVGLLDGERAWVSACGTTIPVGFSTRGETLADDEFRSEIRRTEGPCAVVASRRDGTLTATSEPVYIDPADGDVTGLVLVLPEERIGGIGVPVGPHPDGMIVQAPTPGSPADLAGLEEGDVVVAVDGVPVGGWDLYEIIHEVTGPVGSTVQLTVQMPGGERQTVAVVRQAID